MLGSGRVSCLVRALARPLSRFTRQVGTYRLCWCGGATGCWSIHHYEVDAGTISVLGPYPDQSVVCVIGRLCEDMGPIQGLGLQSSDLVNVRSACKAPVSAGWSRGCI